MHLQESGQMYLETILLLSKSEKNVRSIDIVEHMGYSKPSVSRAVGLLRQGGYLVVEENGHLVLTEEGRRAAEKTYERHRILTKVFVSLGVPEEIASEDACKIEHVISDESFEAIKSFAAKTE